MCSYKSKGPAGTATPLHLAASTGLLDCAEVLVNAGADVSAKDNRGYTPLDLARIWSHRKMARYPTEGNRNGGEKAGSSFIQRSCNTGQKGYIQ
uniref:Uncharacterized protein n=1 Tax=Oryzias latipes TaxID=8090 RepID=A0A3B3IA95_ORYLA